MRIKLNVRTTSLRLEMDKRVVKAEQASLGRLSVLGLTEGQTGRLLKSLSTHTVTRPLQSTSSNPKWKMEEAAGTAIIFVASGSVIIHKEKFRHSRKLLPVKLGDGDMGGELGPSCAWTQGGFRLRHKRTGNGLPSIFPLLV